MNGFFIYKKQLDRINRIERPSSEGPLAAGQKNPVYPVNPVYKKIKIESIPCPPKADQPVLKEDGLMANHWYLLQSVQQIA